MVCLLRKKNPGLLSLSFSCFFFFFISLYLYILSSSPVHAQGLGVGVAVRVTLLDKDAPDGSIVSWSAGGYRLASIPYDSGLFGVVVDNPALSLEDSTLPQSHPVLSSGKTLVRVSSANGPIKEGDAVTSSGKPGVGQKVDRGGYVLGKALEDFTGGAGEEGKILVDINIRSSTAKTLRENLLDMLQLSVLASVEAPLNALRYLLAAVFVVLSFLLGFVFFGRVVVRSVEAMGRNPLAGGLITAGVIFNIFLMLIIMLAGLIMAYLILSF